MAFTARKHELVRRTAACSLHPSHSLFLVNIVEVQWCRGNTSPDWECLTGIEHATGHERGQR